jgi:hypothetical protein
MTDISAISSDNNLSTGAIYAPSSVGQDFSRFDKGVQPTNDTQTMSFDDFIDMINPLEHIPAVSSIYRAVTNETINPVSRIVGDTLYGGILGLASAGIGALGAIGDEMIAANNDGDTTSKTVFASLFGDDKKSSPVQLASSAGPSATTTTDLSQTAALQTSVLQTPATQSPILDMPSLSNPQSQVAQAAPASSSVAQNIPAAADAPSATIVANSAPSQGIPLDRSKPAYGGVMDSSMVQSAQQNQTLALAMSGQNNMLQTQRALRSSRFATASAGLPGATGANAAASTLPGASPATAPITAESTVSQLKANPETQAAMQTLMKELQDMKGINQYKNAAQSLPVPGTSVNIAN